MSDFQHTFIRTSHQQKLCSKRV